MEVSIGDLKLAALQGLMGKVFPNLRAVCVNANDHLIQIYFYYKDSISEKEEIVCQNAVNQMKADLLRLHLHEKSEIRFESAIIRIDFPKKMPLIGSWVFYRQEDSSQYVD
jgi:hypothetical protein